MTTPSGPGPAPAPGPDDSFWRRPAADAEDPGTGPSGPVPPAGPPDPGYPGPPTAPPPAAGWRPPVHLRPAPPRRLPAQDPGRLDEAERSARTVTYGVGMIAGAVVLVLICLLCSRVLF
ncbi:translation initiation factor 2 [Micromonospora sp. CPCC 206060]|uniref:translation initiation factor 2 n=1 Tax=Micromonospora sp. CPCC 206060 TaxID=3122406 RepID=UPI002FF26B9F